MRVINYNALNGNVKFFRRLIGNAKLCAVLKNDAYGHGLVHIARYLAPQVDCFAVGSTAEAEQISFLGKETLILLPQCQADTELAVRRGYVLTLDSFYTLPRITKAAQKVGIKAHVHIKIDSGMSRLGFVKEELDELIGKIDESKLSVEGIFSHFWGEKVEQCDQQLYYFEQCVDKIKKYFPDAICHIANTSATLLSPKYHMDMVRIGLGLYGYGCQDLTPVKVVSANVLAVKTVEEGSAVGYDAIYRPTHKTNIAVLNTGYACGLPRSVRGGILIINGKSCPIVAICMAMTLVDVGNAKISVGDTVTLLGDGVNLSNDNVIVYELLCNLQ